MVQDQLSRRSSLEGGKADTFTFTSCKHALLQMSFLHDRVPILGPKSDPVVVAELINCSKAQRLGLARSASEGTNEMQWCGVLDQAISKTLWTSSPRWMPMRKLACLSQRKASHHAAKSFLLKNLHPEDAFTELRKKGLAAATKKSSRVAADGLLGLAHFEKGAAVIEINSETDFVARNDLFQSLVLSVAKAASTLEAVQQFSSKPAALDLHDLELVNVKLDHASITRELCVRDAVSEVAAITGENVRLRRAFYISSQRGIVSSYLHMSPASGLSRLAGLVALEVEDDQEGSHSETLKSLGSSLAMHVVAARPLFLSKELVDSEVLEHERNICKAQASTAGKPENVVQKMVEGRLAKYMEEVVLLEQKYVADETKWINVLLKETSKEIGKTAKIEGFLRIEVGEGIEKLEKDFAAEVAAAAR
ncbi:hypothetical protein SELMODRAFT_437874 [Selaginella moellendorffii]|uniref:Elongation factor Ts, mitochondrial n=1 Tax=Selaginella moellendorffii TaxID=88036 RepID=D8QRL9_SELML|nr:hypothetical protein SELMODRAFT_437874 [Selaginella moellendorffii]